MSSTSPQRLVSVDDYLAGEERAEVRHEYVAGRLFAMSGASIARTFSSRLFSSELIDRRSPSHPIEGVVALHGRRSVSPLPAFGAGAARGEDPMDQERPSVFRTWPSALRLRGRRRRRATEELRAKGRNRRDSR